MGVAQQWFLPPGDWLLVQFLLSLLRVLLLEAGERMTSIVLYSRLSVYVDDATIETICLQRSVVEQHANAVNCFVGYLGSMRLRFSAPEYVTSATTDALARVVNNAIAGISIKVASRVTSLGTGLGAGRRRNMVQVKKRCRGFVARRSRFRRLRRAGIKTERVVRTGGNAFMTCYGSV
jgi:hypothetical protein